GRGVHGSRAMLVPTAHAPREVGVAGVSIHNRPRDDLLLDSSSETVPSAVKRAGAAVIHLEVRENEAPGGSGSGFFISPDGYALTNSHVVHGAREIRVALADGRRLGADLIGDDPDTDLAVVRVRAADVSHLEFADSDRIRAGQI